MRADHDKIIERVTVGTDGTRDAVRQRATADPDHQAFQAGERQVATATFGCREELERVRAEVHRAHMS